MCAGGMWPHFCAMCGPYGGVGRSKWAGKPIKLAHHANAEKGGNGSPSFFMFFPVALHIFLIFSRAVANTYVRNGVVTFLIKTPVDPSGSAPQ